ncbi:MAG: pentapeptide repeat-containing protein [Pseudomonadota bacterium]
MAVSSAATAPTGISDPASAGRDEGAADKLEKQLKDLRSVFFSLLVITVYSGLSVLTLTDAEFFTAVRMFRLPIISVDISLIHFIVIAPLIIFGLHIVYFLLLFKARRFVTAPENCHVAHDAYVPVYFRWFVLPRRDETMAEGLADLAVGSFVPILVSGVLFFFWWEVLILHDWLLAAFIGLLFVSTLFVYIVASSLYVRRFSGKSVTISVGVVAVVFVVLVKVSLDLSGVSLFGERVGERTLSFPVRGASLSGAKLTQFNSSDLHRYRWIRRYYDDFFRSGSDGAYGFRNGVEFASRDNFEDEWRAVRGQLFKHARKPQLARSNLSGANLRDAVMVGIDATEAVFDDATFDRAQMEGFDARRSSFRGASFFRTRLHNGDFVAADLRGAKAQNVIAQEANFTRADARDGIFFGARFHYTNFRNAKFNGADLRRAIFRGSNLIDAQFGNARVKDAVFDDAVLIGANLSDVVGLTREQLANAFLDDSTHLPPHLVSGPRPGRDCLRGIDPPDFPYAVQWWMRHDQFKDDAFCKYGPDVSAMPRLADASSSPVTVAESRKE